MEPVTLSAFLTVTGAAGLIIPVFEALKRALAWPPATVDRFGPAISMVLGIVLVVAGTVVGATSSVLTVSDVFTAAITGILAGAMSTGLYQLGGKGVVEKVAGPA